MKTTKKAITQALRSENTTEIFKIAVLNGINVNNRGELFRWIKENAPSKKVYKKAYNLSYGAAYFKDNRIPGRNTNTVEAVISEFKFQKNREKDSYTKILIVIENNIFWASPIYREKDYNKAVAMPLTDRNEKIAELINILLYK